MKRPLTPMIVGLTLFSLSFTAAAGRSAEKATQKETKETKSEWLESEAELICILETDTRSSCTGEDLYEVFEVGIIVVPDPELPEGTYEDSTCPLNDGDYGRDGTYVLAEGLVYYVYDPSEHSATDEWVDYPACGGGADEGSSSVDTCIAKCKENLAHCTSTIHVGGVPEEQNAICEAEFGQACEDKC